MYSPPQSGFASTSFHFLSSAPPFPLAPATPFGPRLFVPPVSPSDLQVTPQNLVLVERFIQSLGQHDFDSLMAAVGVDHDAFASPSVCALFCGHDHSSFASPSLCSAICGHSHSSFAIARLCKLTTGVSTIEYALSAYPAGTCFASRGTHLAVLSNWVQHSSRDESGYGLWPSSS